MKWRTGVRGLVLLGLLTALAMLIPGSPVYLPEFFTSSDQYEGRSSRSWAHDLTSPDTATQVQAIFALGSIGEPAGEAAPALAEIMTTNSDADLRAKAALALSKMGPASRPVLPALTQALKDPEPLVRLNTAHALFRLGADARPSTGALIEALQDPQNAARADLYRDTIQEIVALALGRATAGTDEAVPALTAALKGARTDGLRVAACRALGMVGPPAAAALPAIQDQLASKESVVKAAAEKARQQIQGNKPISQAPAPPKAAELPETKRQ